MSTNHLPSQIPTAHKTHSPKWSESPKHKPAKTLEAVHHNLQRICNLSSQHPHLVFFPLQASPTSHTGPTPTNRMMSSFASAAPYLQTQFLECVCKNFLTWHKLLYNEGGNGNHRKSTVVQLLGLHILLRCRVWREQAQRIEAKVAGLVVLSQEVEVLGTWVGPAESHSVCLTEGNDEDQRLPEHGTTRLHLLEVVYGRACHQELGIVRSKTWTKSSWPALSRSGSWTFHQPGDQSLCHL